MAYVKAVIVVSGGSDEDADKVIKAAEKVVEKFKATKANPRTKTTGLSVAIFS